MLGRTIRVVIGALLFASLAQLVLQVRQFLAPLPAWQIPRGDWWVVALGCLFALPMIVDSGFGRRWGRSLQLTFVALFMATGTWDRLVYGRLWAVPFALVSLVLIIYVFAHAGVSFLVSALAATPG